MDVVLGAAAVAGALAAVALVLGIVFAGVILGVRRLRRQDGLTPGGGTGLNLGVGG